MQIFLTLTHLIHICALNIILSKSQTRFFLHRAMSLSSSSPSAILSTSHSSKNVAGSKIWIFFKKDISGKAMAKCQLCKNEYKTSGNTSNFMDHSKRKHKAEFENIHTKNNVYYALVDEHEIPICYWAEQKDNFSLLYEIAIKYLCIPATSVPSERCFSASGEILSDRRSRLTSEHVNMLVFLNQNKCLLE